MTQPIRPGDALPDDADDASFADVTARKAIAAFVANAKLLDDLPVDHRSEMRSGPTANTCASSPSRRRP